MVVYSATDLFTDLDQYLVSKFKDITDCSPTQFDQLNAVYQQQRGPNESLVDFLKRKSVFNQAADGILGAVRHGYMPMDRLSSVWNYRGQQALLSLIAPKPLSNITDSSGQPSELPIRSTPSNRFDTTPWIAPPPSLQPRSEILGPDQLHESEKLRHPSSKISSFSDLESSVESVDSIFDNDDSIFSFAGTRLGKCILGEKLGQGGWGVVYRAFHTTLDISVAVKMLRPRVVENYPGMVEQFRREARLLAQLNHPNIVRVLHFEDEGPIPYLVIEYVEGLSLRDLIEQGGRLTPERSVRLVRQVAEALWAAQRVNIVHRDVTPGNIMMGKQNQAKLTDFGLAMMVADSPGQANNSEAMGTPAYMSPEQGRTSTGRVDHRSDQYTLGASFYHAVTGRLPFEADSAILFLSMHADQTPRPPHELVNGLPLNLSAIIMKMLEKKPHHRFENYGALISALDTLDLYSAKRTHAARRVRERGPLHRAWRKFLPKLRSKRSDDHNFLNI